LCSSTPTLNLLGDIKSFTTLVWEASLQRHFRLPDRFDSIMEMINDNDFVAKYEDGSDCGTIGPSDSMSSKVTSNTTTKIMQQTQVLIVNRGMTTPLKLSNGSISYPSADIPLMRIFTVHLQHGVKKHPVVDFTNSLL
ncbi:hypothetical protein QBC45DRAFT_315445, partial [Copromyces sp. CBS 386.78]